MLTDRLDPASANRARLGLALALLAAGLLRFWALPHGVPFSLQVDEPEVMLRAVRMMKTGDLNPHFFDYPTLYMYVQALVATARFLAGAVHGEWASLAQAPPEAFYVWGRAVTAIAGTATVWVLYRAAHTVGTAHGAARRGHVRRHAPARPRVALRPDGCPGDVLRDAHSAPLAARARARHGVGVRAGRHGGRPRGRQPNTQEASRS